MDKLEVIKRLLKIPTLESKTDKTNTELNNLKEVVGSIEDSIDDINDSADDLQTQIDTWNNFKVNGGSVGGMISLLKDWAGFMVSNTAKTNQWYNYANPTGSNMILAKPGREYYGFGESDFSPIWNASGSINLGSENTPWSDIFLTGYSKLPNGFTKLPNGLIMQWGYLENCGSSGDQWINLPIAFPNSTLNLTATFNGKDENTNPKSIIGFCTKADEKTKMRIRWRYAQDASDRCDIYWTAIGY